MSSKTNWLDKPRTGFMRSSSSAVSRISMQKIAAVMLLLVCIFLPRAVALHRLITPDENRWMARSANFYYAFSRGDFADTYQIEHPGVLTMWSGMFAFLSYYPEYRDQAPGLMEWWRDDLGSFLKEQGYDPLALLVASRLNMVILITVVLLTAFWAASKLFGFWPALTGFLLIALDPFHTALSRLLHVDGLPSSLALLSLLAFLNYLYRGGNRRDLLLSGVAAGLAWLTKSPMLFLIPFVGLLVLIELVKKWRSQNGLVLSDVWRALFPMVLWGSAGLAVFVLLWPAMWVEPIHTLRRLGGAMVSYADQGHDSALFFNGSVFEGDPGPHFYPITFLWRSTPIVLLGLALAALALALPGLRLISSEQRRPLGALLLFAVLFALFMNFGAKKFDRYLLPAYAPLDLAAGVGLVATITWIGRQLPGRWALLAPPALVLVALVGQAVGTASTYPYYFSYYNPLLGGTTRAPEVMMLGWGEGLDQAARFLNNQPDAVNRQVATGVWSTTFSYYYNGPVVSTRFEPGAGSVKAWEESDYYVLYINEKQREKISPALAAYLATLEPVEVVRINGIEYASVYEIRDLPPPDFLSLPASTSAENPELSP